jgi:hypothetical protein
MMLSSEMDFHNNILNAGAPFGESCMGGLPRIERQSAHAGSVAHSAVSA